MVATYFRFEGSISYCRRIETRAHEDGASSRDVGFEAYRSITLHRGVEDE